MEESILNQIINTQLKNASYECDRGIKNKAIAYFKNQFESKGFSFEEDFLNNNNPKAKTDIMFSITRNNRTSKYAIEVKQRKHLVGDYEDEMFEIEKYNNLKELNKKGYKVFFLEVFADGYCLLFDVLKPTRKGTAYTYDSTVEATPTSPKTPKEKIYYSVTDDDIIKAKFYLK